jgi:hypothetical protein
MSILSALQPAGQPLVKRTVSSIGCDTCGIGHDNYWKQHGIVTQITGECRSEVACLMASIHQREWLALLPTLRGLLSVENVDLVIVCKNMKYTCWMPCEWAARSSGHLTYHVGSYAVHEQHVQRHNTTRTSQGKRKAGWDGTFAGRTLVTKARRPRDEYEIAGRWSVRQALRGLCKDCATLGFISWAP